MKGLLNKRIGIASDRQSGTIASLVLKHGGTPEIFSIQGTRQRNETACIESITTLIRKPFDWVILTTGIGAKALEKTAAENQPDGKLSPFTERKKTGYQRK
ncbi:hypothetical protein OYT88_10625 [Sporolactobacillus sp. CQH2019]|uniref:hypothetical protein n=1 Tax=Sporolactobacillus sp. CQH2019 TaxID=3023512 RepID=UPI002367FF05|nr:hypothetical protein [Sporolactobacillus sp. CQH2019]MDD9149004.1 hypothetical protein [Sporolactobacillus sp. CQH2019]